MEDVRSTCRIEHVRPIKEARERLAVLAIADETKADMRRDTIRDAAHVAAPAAKQEILGGAGHQTLTRIDIERPMSALPPKADTD